LTKAAISSSVMVICARWLVPIARPPRACCVEERVVV
jgi:hypothetical protein